MSNAKIDSSRFHAYAERVKKQISLLDNFTLPPVQSWKVDWNTLQLLSLEKERTKWQRLEVYKNLLANRKKPAIYFFIIKPNDSKKLYELFMKYSKKSSKKRIENGLKEKGYFNLSHVPKTFQKGSILYVGSRKKNLHQRLLQHLGYGNQRTGALHLKRVISNEKIRPLIEFHYYILDKEYETVTEHIEKVIQEQLKPIIGKYILGD